MAEKPSWDQANRQKLGLVWRNRKKISQIIKDYFYLPFFLLIILCPSLNTVEPEHQLKIDYHGDIFFRILCVQIIYLLDLFSSTRIVLYVPYHRDY